MKNGPDVGSDTRRRRRFFGPVLFFLFFMPLLAVFAWYQYGRTPDEREADARTAGEVALRRRLAQAVVAVMPAGGVRGYGVLIDCEDGLVVTVNSVVGDRGEVDIVFLTRPQTGLVGRVVSNDASRGLMLLHLDRLPAEAAALPLGEWSTRPDRPLYTFTGPDRGPPSGEEHSWSLRCGRIGQVLQVPHY